MRLYSSAVMLCAASNSGVMSTGSGTTAEEAVVITIAFIVAWRSSTGEKEWVWKPGVGGNAAFAVQTAAVAELERGTQRHIFVADGCARIPPD